MSTKLYNGYLVNPDADIFEAVKLIREPIDKAFFSLAQELITDELCTVMKSYLRAESPIGFTDEFEDFQGINANRGLWFCLAQKWEQEQAKESMYSVWDDPLRFQIIFIPVRDSKNKHKKLLAYSFSGNERVYNGALESILTNNNEPLLTDYHYQNSTDRPDEVSASEWAMRKRDWNKILDESDGTLEGHPGYTLTDTRKPFGKVKEFAILSLDENLDILPYSLEEMCKQVMRSLLIDHVNLKLNEKTPSAPFDFGTLMRIVDLIDEDESIDLLELGALPQRKLEASDLYGGSSVEDSLAALSPQVNWDKMREVVDRLTCQM